MPTDVDDDEDLTTIEDTPEGLRQAANRAPKYLKQRDQANARADAAERELAVHRAGLALKPTQIKALLAIHDGELTAEELQKTATELGFVTAAKDEENPDDQLEAEITAQQQISAASNGAGRTAPSTVLKPEEVNTWPTEKLLRLNRTYPDAYEQLMRGEEVAGVSFV